MISAWSSAAFHTTKWEPRRSGSGGQVLHYLTPSRAAILASLEPADADLEMFVRRLGIEKIEALVNGVPWTLTGRLVERVQRQGDRERLPVDAAEMHPFVMLSMSLLPAERDHSIREKPL